MSTERVTLKLDQIRIDGGTQPRVIINEQVVAEYAELYADGVDLPAVEVFYDGENYWLADGFHRYHANRKITCEYIFANIHQGTQRDAILYSVGANARHGLRRTSADKRKAILTLLSDAAWGAWSDREIARRCGVDGKTVGAARKSITEEIPQSEKKPRTYKTKHGTVAKMKTGNIGRNRNRNRHRHRGPDSPNPVRQPNVAPAQININLPHDPEYGARAIVNALGADYGHRLIDCLTVHLQNLKEGVA